MRSKADCASDRRLKKEVSQKVEDERSKHRNDAVELHIAAEQEVERFIGRSRAFQSIIETIKTIAPRNTSVLIAGETGTGKEMVARQVHLHSRRAEKPFIPVDCTTLTGPLCESQLFGHVKGAFTGATSSTLGFFRAGDGGTVFLDEIGELELDLQAKLLRVLQESCITPLGATKPCRINVRILCSTNRDLKEMVRRGTFRADLYFRLNTIQLTIPPLRERKKDILVLANYFLGKQAKLYDEPYKTLSPRTAEILYNYHWPGNVRELQNVTEQAYVMSAGKLIDLVALPDNVFADEPVEQGKPAVRTLDEVKKDAVIEALNAAEGRKTHAARKLGIGYRRLIRLVNKYALHGSYKISL
jgi:transcriptional regulator with PAS, ATPase and Fis domain